MNVRKWLFSVAVAGVSLGALASGSIAQCVGKVMLDGKAPEMQDIDMTAVKECNDMHPDPIKEEDVVVDDKNDLANVIVFLKKEKGVNLGPHAGDIPKTPAKLTQKGCQYIPHVVAVMVGQDLLVANDDEHCTHNVHSLSTDNPPFNLFQTGKTKGENVGPFKLPETFQIKCDVHGWMKAWVRVIDVPFFAVSKTDGTFSVPLAGVPDGQYTFVAWQETYGEVEQKVTVKDGKASVNFVFKADDAK